MLEKTGLREEDLKKFNGKRICVLRYKNSSKEDKEEVDKKLSFLNAFFDELELKEIDIISFESLERAYECWFTSGGADGQDLGNSMFTNALDCRVDEVVKESDLVIIDKGLKKYFDKIRKEIIECKI